MRIDELSVQAFGACRELDLDDLSPGLTVVYGTNEAGKTTLMNFVRAMFYGTEQARLQRYLPPTGGGRGGGQLRITTLDGPARLARYASVEVEQLATHAPTGNESTRNNSTGHDELAITLSDGSPRGAAWLAAMLSDVDERMFNNVFAIGLGEIQELATLSDGEAARLLYDLSTGRDRVSLGEVTRELAASREHLLPADGRGGQIAPLLSERRRLRTLVDQLASETPRFTQLISQRREAREQIARLETEVEQLDEQTRLAETAASLADRWRRRAALDADIAALGPAEPLPSGTLDELRDIAARIAKLSRRRKLLGRKHRRLAAEVKLSRVNEVLRRSASRIEALGEQTPFITSLEAQIQQLDTEIAALELQVSSERGASPVVKPAASNASTNSGHAAAARPAAIDPDSPRFAALRPAAKRMREAQQRFEDLEAEVERARHANAATVRELQSSFKNRNVDDLPTAIEKAGLTVAQLRRRMAIDERVEQVKRQGLDVEDDNQRHMREQVLPGWLLGTLGVVFACSAAMLLWGILSGLWYWKNGVNTFQVFMTLGGGAALVAAAIYKLRWEHDAHLKLESGLRQLDALRREMKQLHDERDELDIELPSGGGPLAVRLQAAERELATLEQMLSANARRSANVHDIAGAELQRDQAKTEHERCRQRWKEAVTAAGLPADFSPAQLRELSERGRNVGELQRRLSARQAERDQRRRELVAITARINQLALEVAQPIEPHSTPVQIVGQMVSTLRLQDAAVAERDASRQALGAIVKKRKRCRRAVDALERRRRELVASCGATNESDLHRVAATAAHVVQLRKEREQVHAEIMAAVRAHGSEATLLGLIEKSATAAPSQREREAITRLSACRDELRKLYELRGRIDAEVRSLAADGRLAAAQFDLGLVEQQLDAAIGRYQIVSGVGRVLELLRENYESRKQPQTLIDASAWLTRLTEGKYRRVWTPLGEDELRVDDAQGKSVAVEVLSRGTREQLFLSLRLAIVDAYARRGARLPVVLDDVLVNFDVHRARAAAGVMIDFARQGHQVLVFTCHEHIARLFRQAGADVRRLPGSDLELPAFELATPARIAAEAEPRRLRGRRPKPVEVTVEPEEAPVESAPQPLPKRLLLELPVVELPMIELRLPPKPVEPKRVERTLAPLPTASMVEVFEVMPRVEPIVVSPPMAAYESLVVTPPPPPTLPLRLPPAPLAEPIARPAIVRPPLRRPSPPPQRVVLRPTAPPKPASPPPAPIVEKATRVRWRSKGWDPAIEVPIDEESYEEERWIDVRRDEIVSSRPARREPVVATAVDQVVAAPRLSPPARRAAWLDRPAADAPAAWWHADATEAEFAEYDDVAIDDGPIVAWRHDDDSAAA